MVYFAVYILRIYIFSRLIVNAYGNYTKNELYTVKNILGVRASKYYHNIGEYVIRSETKRGNVSIGGGGQRCNKK